MDNLVVAYFGQDCDIFDANINFDNLLKEYLATSHPCNLRMLLANIQELEQQPAGLAVFSERYKYDFWPERWDMTVEKWIGIVKERVIDNLHSNGYSSAFSHF